MNSSLCEKYKKYFTLGTAINNFLIINEADIDCCLNNFQTLMNIYQRFYSFDKAESSFSTESIKKIFCTSQAYLNKHFNLITPENDMKMEFVYPSENTFYFDWVDKFISFAKINQKKIRWHTLVWHKQNPDWIFKNINGTYVNKSTLEQRLRNYIYTLGERYKNDIYSIDVVNECLSDKTYSLRTGKDNSLWYEIIGPDYIEKSFFWAKEAFPRSELVINDYNLEIIPEKRLSMLTLLQNLLNKGIPIDSVGLQMHLSLQKPSISEIEKTIESFGKLNLKVVITELDISIYDDYTKDYLYEPKKVITKELMDKQAERYFQVFECLKKEAEKGIVKDVLLWGLLDRFSWRNNFPVKNREDSPLLFDKDGNPKPAFLKLIEK